MKRRAAKAYMKPGVDFAGRKKNTVVIQCLVHIFFIVSYQACLVDVAHRTILPANSRKTQKTVRHTSLWLSPDNGPYRKPRYVYLQLADIRIVFFCSRTLSVRECRKCLLLSREQ